MSNDDDRDVFEKVFDDPATPHIVGVPTALAVLGSSRLAKLLSRAKGADRRRLLSALRANSATAAVGAMGTGAIAGHQYRGNRKK